MNENADNMSVREFDAARVFKQLLKQLGPLNPMNLITIQGMVFDSLDEAKVAELLNTYSQTIDGPAMYVRDPAINRVFLGPRVILQGRPLMRVAGQIHVLMASHIPAASPTNLSTAVTTPQTNTTTLLAQIAAAAHAPGGKKIPRPPNAFIIYRKAHHAATVAENPGLHNNDISIIIGRKWNDESAEVRADYKAQEEKMKQEHLLRHPGYSYRPRKPSEKKKRMSKKKAAALLADQLAAENRAQSMMCLDRYAWAEDQHDILQQHRLVDTSGGDRQMEFPLPDLPSSVLLRDIQTPATQLNVSDGNGAQLGFNLTPSQNYQWAQASDMAFFPPLDLNDPTLQQSFDEVTEAFAAGYYRNAEVSDQGVHSGDFNYALQNYDRLL